jgi:hypothetical protein
LARTCAFSGVSFRFAHGFLELALEVGSHTPYPPRPLSERPQNGRQFLRADEDQRHDADQQKLGPRDVEHENFPAGSPLTCVSTAGPLPVGSSREGRQDTLLSARCLTSA